MKSFVKIWIVLLLVTGIYADNPEIILFSTQKSDTITAKSIEDTFIKSGYKVESNRDMNVPFKKQFNKTSFAIYNLMLVYDPKISEQLVPKYENSGIFTPFTILMYQKKGDNRFYVGCLSAKAMSRITGHNDPLFKKLEEHTVETIKKALPNATRVSLPYSPKSLKKEWLTKFEMEADAEEIDDVKEETEMVLEDGLKPIGFVMANFLDYNYFLKETGDDTYLFYDNYSLCKLKVIYTVSQVRPEAGVFAPCTLSVYYKKDSGKIKLVYPNVYNWIYTLALDDKNAIKELEKAQKDMVELLNKVIE